MIGVPNLYENQKSLVYSRPRNSQHLFMDSILAIDYGLFEWINHGWQSDWLDAIMPWWRNKTTWIPLYLLAVALLIWRYRLQCIPLLLLIGLTIGVSDLTSSQLIKKTVQRARPCNETTLNPPARIVAGCGGGYSFPSSHATNHFALATLLFLTWGRLWGRWRNVLLLWAASIALGQVYVGVHYPIDICIGALLGTLIGFSAALLYRKSSRFRIAEFYPSTPIA